MRKLSFAIVLSLVLVFAFAGMSMAAQVAATIDGQATYLSTPKVFNPDGKANYPYEIYLPNEQNPENYRIHSNYTKNTDACASCHATHTAVGGSLLQWYSSYETCMACHDGTVTTTYDVQGGNIGTSGKATFGGHFGNGAEGSLSNHNVTGAMEIAAAPGGSTVGEAITTPDGKAGTRWSVEFGCESCHSPHGQGGNARILSPDPNFTATKNFKTGLALTQIDSVTYAAYPNGDTAKTPLTMISGYPYSKTTAFYVDGVKTDATIDNKLGYTLVKFASAPAGAVTADFYPSVKVAMNITDYLKGTETVTHKSGMNAFCGACHTDYNTENYDGNGAVSGSAEVETGTYSKAHRHQVGFYYGYSAGKLATANMVLENGNMECLTCHVAHGASDDYWTRTVGSTAVADGRLTTAYITDDANLVELAGSSALKRLPNMGTCEACHAKGAGNEGYNVNTGQEGFVNSAPTSADNSMPNTYIFSALAASWDASDKGWVGSSKCEPCHKEYFEGWKETAHSTSNHTGATSCGRCHNPGNSIMGSTATFVAGGQDAGITCESCHGTGARHIQAPSSKNIFNPGKTTIERQAVECGRCHDMYGNNAADSFGLSAKSGTAAAPAGVYKTADLVNQSGWSVAFRVYNEDPAKFAIASQKTATSNHYGGAWGYADSKHFLGNGTAENPNGIVSCNTCHNQHSDKNAGLLKQTYTQVCSACHDMTANLVPSVAMPTNSWNRHQLELTDYAHSFKFGSAATIAAMDVKTVNLEAAVSGQNVTPEVNTFKYTYASANGAANLWRASQTGGGGVGQKIIAYSDAGKTTQVFNNYEVKWELIAHPATVTEGSDFEFVAQAGAVEFTNPGTTDPADSAKFAGDYTLKYTSKANPSVTGTVTFTVTP